MLVVKRERNWVTLVIFHLMGAKVPLQFFDLEGLKQQKCLHSRGISYDAQCVYHPDILSNSCHCHLLLCDDEN